MPTGLGLFSAAAGGVGSPYLTILSFLAKAIGNYVINDTNFPGVGRYLPGWVTVVSGTPANVTIAVSTDNGTTWKTGPTGGGAFYADAGGVTGVGQGVSTAATVRVQIVTLATDIFLFPLLNG